MIPSEQGLSISVKKYLSIHETPYFHFCIDEYNKDFLAKPMLKTGESNRQALERMNIKIYRIAKSGSRIAFETEQKAFEQLLFLKRKQLDHLKRDTQFLTAFIDYCSDKKYEDVPLLGSFRTVPDSQELVNEHYVFD